MTHPLEEGKRRIPTTVSLTAAQHKQFKELGGSVWLRERLSEAAKVALYSGQRATHDGA